MSLFELLFGVDFSPSDADEYRRIVASNSKLRVDTVSAVSVLALENDRLRLYCAALARLLLKKGVVSVEEISAMIDTVDLEDGVADGRLKGRPLPGECPRPLPKKPVGKAPKRPARTLPKPPKGWKPKGGSK